MIATMTLNSGRAIPSDNSPVIFLRLEGLALLFAACVGFQIQHGSWLLFALLFLAPDISMLGYFAGPRVGALAYNLLHTTTLYILVLGLGVRLASPLTIQVALIGLSHIGFDRLVGYGLKYATEFKDTHLTRLQARVE